MNHMKYYELPVFLWFFYGLTSIFSDQSQFHHAQTRTTRPRSTRPPHGKRLGDLGWKSALGSLSDSKHPMTRSRFQKNDGTSPFSIRYKGYNITTEKL